MTPNNPLKQYFRQPSIYIRLPSQGQYYPDGALDMPPNQELPVLPMTAVDEITYRTPDALFNGAAMVNVIQSCCPNIKDAWSIPAMDVDTILVGIRVASYGHSMELGSQCPKCKHDHEFSVDLRQVLDQLKTPDYTSAVRYGDLEFYFRPMTYKNLNENNQLQFEQQKVMAMMPDSEIPDADKISSITDALKRLTMITIEALCQSIGAIKTPSALVTEQEFIRELMQNCDRNVFNGVRDHIVKLKTSSELQPLKITCPECQNAYDQGMTLDMSSFFAAAS
jgi:T4 bacteriophage base plate protein